MNKDKELEEAAEATGQYQGNISRCCLGRCKTLKGSIFSYKKLHKNNIMNC